MDIEVELSRIVIDEASDQQIIVLKEKKGSRTLPIVIGIVEIMAIDRRLKGKMPLRPLTHDLLGNIIGSLGAYYATIHISLNDKKTTVDARPSDAIAVGIATNVPIFAAEHVFGNG